MNNNRILMLYGATRYNAMNNYLDELGAVYKKLGYEVDYVNCEARGFVDELYRLTYNNEYKVIFACNNIVTDFSVLNRKNSIICCLMFDHPIHHFGRLEKADERVVVIHCDEKSAEYISEYCPNVGSVAFVPLSGSYIDNNIPYRDRRYDVIFTGSNMNSQKTYEDMAGGISGETKRLADMTINVMKNSPDLTFQDAFRNVIREEGLVMTDRFFHVKLSKIYYVDMYMRAWLREQVVRSIVDSGIKLNVYGEGWDNFECNHPENIIIMEGNAEKALQAVADSRIALNVMPWFRGGFQERIASAMLCGTVALTDSSTYIEDNFRNGEDILVYDRNDLEGIPAIIMDILNNPDKGECIADNGYRKAIDGHTWRHRAIEIMNIIDESIAWLESVKNSNDINNVNESIPKVSVIVPVYNSERTLGDCLGNLVNQTIDSIEIIIVDCNSSDGSRKIINDCYEQYYDRVKVVLSGDNISIKEAVDIGILKASGEYTGIVDSNDLLDIALYENLYCKAVEDGYDIVETGYYDENKDVAILYISDDCTGRLDDYKRNELLSGDGGNLFNRIFKSELLRESGGFAGNNYDIEDFNKQLFRMAESTATIKNVLCVHR